MISMIIAAQPVSALRRSGGFVARGLEPRLGTTSGACRLLVLFVGLDGGE
jgi:hypothetical protein